MKKKGWKLGCENGGFLRFYLRACEKIRTFAMSMRTTEMARQAGKTIALAKQKILPGQAAKRKSYQRQNNNQ